MNPGDLSWDALKKLGDVTVYDRTPEYQVAERAKDAEVIFTNKCPVSEEAINQLPSLQYIGVLATGYNIVNTEAAKSKGIMGSLSGTPADAGTGLYRGILSSFAAFSFTIFRRRQPK